MIINPSKPYFTLERRERDLGIEKFWNSMVPGRLPVLFLQARHHQPRKAGKSQQCLKKKREKTEQKKKLLCSSHFITYCIPQHLSKWMHYMSALHNA